MDTRQNPQAFPAAGPSFENGGDFSPGMTLRDWFAGQALQNADLTPGQAPDYDLRNMFGPDRTGIRREEIAAAQAYRIADAMLEARAKGGA